MIWSAIAKGIYWTLGVIQGAGELVGAGRKLAREAWRGTRPLDDTDPIPLTHREINRREHLIRCASRPMDSPAPPGCPGERSHATLPTAANREKREHDP